MTVQKVLQTLDGIEANSMTDQTPNSAAAHPADYFLQRANNLSDLLSATAARTALGLGSIAVEDKDALYAAWRDAITQHVKDVLTLLDLQDTPNSYTDPQPYMGGAIGRVTNDGTAFRFADGVRIAQQRLLVGVGAVSNESTLMSLTSSNYLYVGDYGTNTAVCRVGIDKNLYISGNVSPGGADVAEWMENTGAIIPPGTPVVVEGGLVRAANGGDATSDIIGVARNAEGVSLACGAQLMLRREKYVCDDFDHIQVTPTQFWRWLENDSYQYVLYTGPVRPVGVPETATTVWMDITQYNVGFSETTPQTPLQDRTNYTLVGLWGKMQVLNGSPVNPKWIDLGAHGTSCHMYLVGTP